MPCAYAQGIYKQATPLRFLQCSYCTFLVSFAYVLGQILSIFAYDLGIKSSFFAYDLGKHCTFAKNESYDIQTINRRFREVESAF